MQPPVKARSRFMSGAFGKRVQTALSGGDWGRPLTSGLNSFRVVKTVQTHNGVYRRALLATIKTTKEGVRLIPIGRI